jgi:hypothetical protein
VVPFTTDDPRTSAHALLGSFPSQVRDSKTRQVQNGPSSQPISPQGKGATSTIDNRPITQFPPRSAFLPGNRQSQLPIFCDQPTQHRGPLVTSAILPFQFGQVCSAAPALAPCLKWVRRIDRRRLPLLTSLHSSLLLLLISPTLSWTRISPLRDDLILNRVRLSLLPYLQLRLHLFQIVPLSFFYDH